MAKQRNLVADAPHVANGQHGRGQGWTWQNEGSARSQQVASAVTKPPGRDTERGRQSVAAAIRNSLDRVRASLKRRAAEQG